MSKERIDYIKETYEMSKYDENYGLGMKDIEWLIEQAERVHELEEDYEYMAHHYGLETEGNKRYREAIEKSAMIIKSLPRTSGKTKLYSILKEALDDDYND